MAKQSGIHQLRGKVGEHSYYRQTGVQSGLVRFINQGMSAKVKTDAAFVNTRLNNAEFGQAGRLASMVADYIQPKFRPMILPFSQSKMAKIFLDFIKLDNAAEWGRRNLTQGNSAQAQVDALNAVAKNNFRDWGISITDDEESTKVTLTCSTETANKLAAIGANGLTIKFYAATSWIGTFQVSENRYAQSFARANAYEDTIDGDISSSVVEFTYTLRPAPPTGWPAFMAGRMGVAIVLPYREVSGAYHILQEHCTYFAFEMQDGQIL